MNNNLYNIQYEWYMSISKCIEIKFGINCFFLPSGAVSESWVELRRPRRKTPTTQASCHPSISPPTAAILPASCPGLPHPPLTRTRRPYIPVRTSTHTLQRCLFHLHHPLSATTSLAVGPATTAAHMRIMTPANFQTRQSTLYWNLTEVILLTMSLLSATLGWMPRTPITCPTVWDPGAGSTQVVCMHSRKWIFSHCIMVAVVVISTNTRGHHRPMLT